MHRVALAIPDPNGGVALATISLLSSRSILRCGTAQDLHKDPHRKENSILAMTTTKHFSERAVGSKVGRRWMMLQHRANRASLSEVARVVGARSPDKASRAFTTNRNHRLVAGGYLSDPERLYPDNDQNQYKFTRQCTLTQRCLSSTCITSLTPTTLSALQSAMRVLISGAGIAGPTLAWFLAKTPSRITVLRRAMASVQKATTSTSTAARSTSLRRWAY